MNEKKYKQEGWVMFYHYSTPDRWLPEGRIAPTRKQAIDLEYWGSTRKFKDDSKRKYVKVSKIYVEV